MPSAKPPTPPARPSRNPGGRPKAEITRDALLQMRTFADLVERLDAMTLVRSRSSRANTIEYYLMRAVEADELALGLNDPANVLPLEPPPAFEALSPRVRNSVLEIYARLGRKPKAARVRIKKAG